MIEKKLELTWLYDFYGELLTDKQREVMDRYLSDDLGLVEIGEEMDISRQAVYDKIKKCTKQLGEYEEKLGLLSRYRDRQTRLNHLLDALESIASQDSQATINQAIDEVKSILSL